MIFNKENIKNDRKAGFTILYAVLVATLMLTISVSLYSITSKQYLLSSSSIDSQIAIYAADAGIECALYWDSKGAFKAPPENGIESSSISRIRCNNSPVDTHTVDVSGMGDVFETTFTTDFNGAGATPSVNALGEPTDDLQCAIVVVRKEYIVSGDPSSAIKTTIESRGYNYCTENNRKVERALRVTYPIQP